MTTETVSAWLPPCPTKALLGISCPGCGLTRAFLLCAHGHVLAALRMHPAAPVLLLQGTIACFMLMGARHDSARALRYGRGINKVLRWDCIAMVVLWLVRAALGTLPS
jgi:hypothetical protein